MKRMWKFTLAWIAYSGVDRPLSCNLTRIQPKAIFRWDAATALSSLPCPRLSHTFLASQWQTRGRQDSTTFSRDYTSAAPSYSPVAGIFWLMLMHWLPLENSERSIRLVYLALYNMMMYGVIASLTFHGLR